MPSEKFREHIPEPVKKLIGTGSKVCIINGSSVYGLLPETPFIIMGCNTRIRHVIPGIMRAAEELDAIVAFELTATEGGLDGGYTGQTPDQFVKSLVEYAEICRFSNHSSYMPII